jgi:hypothetical protein
MKQAEREYIETDKVIAIFDIAPFTTWRAGLVTGELLDLLENYLNVVFRTVDSSGGTPRHIGVNGVAGFWSGGNDTFGARKYRSGHR